MNAPLDPNNPNPGNADRRDPDRPDADARDTRDMSQADGQADGMGTVLAIVVVAGLVVIGMLYVMQPSAEPPAKVTGEAPGATRPAPGK